MKRELMMFALIALAVVCRAEDTQRAVMSANDVAAPRSSGNLAEAQARAPAPDAQADAQAPATEAQAPALVAQRPTRPRQAPVQAASVPGDRASNSSPDGGKAVASDDAPKFSSEAKWELAGYNNDEVVYTVFITSQDTHIIRCTTEIKGFYFENGTKLTISDRQITTVFPNQPTRVGYWMDMDQQSGASYAVKCHPV
jgi:hypothetical protein